VLISNLLARIYCNSGLSHRYLKWLVPSLSFTFEILYGSFMLFGRFPAVKGAEVSVFSRFWIRLPASMFLSSSHSLFWELP
jgi:hypothetical protein